MKKSTIQIVLKSFIYHSKNSICTNNYSLIYKSGSLYSNGFLIGENIGEDLYVLNKTKSGGRFLFNSTDKHVKLLLNLLCNENKSFKIRNYFEK
jgi:hypothetical protein